MHNSFGWIDAASHQADVLKVTTLLHEEAIPSFAKHLMKEYPAIGNNHSELIVRCHLMGVNCRWLGKVRAQVPFEYSSVRQMLLIEVLARTIRKLLWNEARKQASKAQVLLHNAIVGTLNAIFDRTHGEAQASYWRTTLQPEALIRFPYCIEPHEENLLSHLSASAMCELFRLVLEYTQIEIDSAAIEQLEHHNFMRSLELREIVGVGIRTRTAFIIPRIGMPYTCERMRE